MGRDARPEFASAVRLRWRIGAVKPARDFFLRPPGRHAAGVILGVPAGFREGVLLLEQQPLVAFAALDSDDRELAAQFFARSDET